MNTAWRPYRTPPKSLPPKQPEMLSLTGESLQCYRAGQHFGMWRALNDASVNVQAAKVHYESQFVALRDALKKVLPEDHELQKTVDALPGLASGFDTLAVALSTKANEHHREGNEVLGELARTNGGRKPWWKSPKFLGWLGYATAVTMATCIALCAGAVLVGYATRHGW